MTIKQRFAADYKLTLAQVNSLCRQANAAADAQEKVHNQSGSIAAELAAAQDARINEFETLAVKLGFTGVDWPGLYPNVRTHDKRWIALPLD